MRKQLLTLMCLAAMLAAGTYLKAQEVTITLSPGWTWIGYLGTEPQDFATALGSFTPEVGDVIKSQWGYASYGSNGQWRGSISQFYPGYGYHYWSNRQIPVTVTIGTPLPQLSVTTTEPTDITLHSATSGGSITTDAYVFAKGICWATHANPTPMEDDHSENGGGNESFTAEMTDLTPNTMYYVRAYMVTDYGLTYGNELSFTTLSGIPVVTTTEVTDVTGNSALCGGTIATDGSLAITARGVCWSTSSTPTIVDAHSTDGAGTGNFSSTLTGLTPNTTYFVRAHATNSYVTVYGNQRSFTTEPLPIYTVSVSCNPTEGGTITGDGTFEQGQGCTLTATANDGYTFTNWTENGEVVSTNATYSFTVNADRTLVANFIQSGSGGDALTGAIDGKFTINADGDQVYFSQGNLQYIGSASTPYWKFADNQWDILGTTTGQNSSSQNVDRDLFGWGTSGYNHGAICYQPWSTSTSNSDYYAYGSYTYNLYDQTGQADWGYNPISNGGNQANQWRTLTQPEWAYIFNTRTTSSGIRYAKAKVNDMNGVILLPDDWSSDTYSLSNTNSTGASFSSNTISASQWNTLEQAGAVFLPAAGSRYGTSVDDVGSYGYYWSASYYISGHARRVFFHDTYLDTDGIDYRYYGFSVRLARVAE